jgi:hypothetical protein
MLVLLFKVEIYNTDPAAFAKRFVKTSYIFVFFALLYADRYPYEYFFDPPALTSYPFHSLLPFLFLYLFISPLIKERQWKHDERRMKIYPFLFCVDTKPDIGETHQRALKF